MTSIGQHFELENPVEVKVPLPNGTMIKVPEEKVTEIYLGGKQERLLFFCHFNACLYTGGETVYLTQNIKVQHTMITGDCFTDTTGINICQVTKVKINLYISPLFLLFFFLFRLTLRMTTSY